MATATSPEFSSRLQRDGIEHPVDRSATGASDGQLEARGDVVIRAIATHKLFVVLMGLILAAAGVGVGLLRKPTYTASATLQVGTVNLNSPGFYGFVQSASDLAGVFSQSITAAPVLAQIDSKLGVPPSEAAHLLSAAPVPLSPSFRIIATGTSATSAITLANAASAAVISYEARSASASSPPTEHLLEQYLRAAQTFQKRSTAVTALARVRHQAGVEDPPLTKAESEMDVARLHLSALGAAYQSALVSTGSNPSTGLVSLVAGAASASNDRKSKLELLGFVGLLAGLMAGAVLASLYEQRRLRRLSA